MSKTSAKFGSDLQLVLQPMIVKPSASAGLTVSPVSSSDAFRLPMLFIGSSRNGCMFVCSSTASHSRFQAFGGLVEVLQWYACTPRTRVDLHAVQTARVQQFIGRPTKTSLSQQDLRALTMLVYIVALLGEHSGFDQIRVTHQGTSRDDCFSIARRSNRMPDVAPDLDIISKVRPAFRKRLLSENLNDSRRVPSFNISTGAC